MRSNMAARGQLFLTGIEVTGRVLGTGSYGSVLERVPVKNNGTNFYSNQVTWGEIARMALKLYNQQLKIKQVKHGGLICAAKQIRDIHLDPRNNGIDRILLNYEKECLLMANLRHPNITQFLGLGYTGVGQPPLLVMEKLEMSVGSLVEHVPNLPISNKISILHDIVNGLVYLHQMSNPIVHRDLTANNVLLTSSLTAKISDLGNSLIIDRTPASLANSFSKCPGALLYMPPEALYGDYRYGPSLDVFSFGHLSLYVLLQELPRNLLANVYLDQSRTQKSHMALVVTIKQCLHNLPGKRPLSFDLLSKMKELKKTIEGKYGLSILNTANILLTMKMALKDKMIKDLMTSESTYKARSMKVENVKTQLEAEVKGLRAEIKGLQATTKQLQSDKSWLQTQKRQLESQNIQFSNEVQILTKEKGNLVAEIKRLKKEIHLLDMENRQLYQGWQDEAVQNETLNKELEVCLEWLQRRDEDRRALTENKKHLETELRALIDKKTSLDNDYYINQQDWEKNKRELRQIVEHILHRIELEKELARDAAHQKASKTVASCSHNFGIVGASNTASQQGAKINHEVLQDDILFDDDVLAVNKQKKSNVKIESTKKASTMKKPGSSKLSTRWETLFGIDDDEDDIGATFVPTSSAAFSKSVPKREALFSDDDDDDDGWLTATHTSRNVKPSEYHKDKQEKSSIGSKGKSTVSKSASQREPLFSDDDDDDDDWLSSAHKSTTVHSMECDKRKPENSIKSTRKSTVSKSASQREPLFSDDDDDDDWLSSAHKSTTVHSTECDKRKPENSIKSTTLSKSTSKRESLFSDDDDDDDWLSSAHGSNPTGCPSNRNKENATKSTALSKSVRKEGPIFGFYPTQCHNNKKEENTIKSAGLLKPLFFDNDMEEDNWLPVMCNSTNVHSTECRKDGKKHNSVINTASNLPTTGCDSQDVEPVANSSL